MSSHDPYAALRLPNYRHFFLGNFLSNMGLQMQTMAVGWDIYVRTESKLALGFAGLVQFLPVITLFLLAGHAADRYARKRIVMAAQVVIALASATLAWIAWTQADYRLIFLCLLAVGVARAFQQPAKAALLPLLVPTSHFASAVTWNSSGFHLASVLGPAAGGLLIKWSGTPVAVYLLDTTAAVIFLTSLLLLRPRPADHISRGLDVKKLAAGFRFVWQNQLVLGALTLDLFAVLLGGAVTLLPVYAEDILKVGPSGLGWLRTAPAAGALMVAMLLAHRPPLTRAGMAMLVSVAGFGIATIVFGVSRSFWLSLAMLFLSGAFDNISVVIRHTLVQTTTPDHLRGRVSAVNSLFIGASNELGGFESGIVAHYLGPVFSVVSGGIGTIIVVLLIGWRMPRVRNYDKLGEELSAK